MTIHEFGIENPEVVVLLHPNSVWWDVFDLVIPALAQRYHLVIPAMPGHDPDQPASEYTSVEEIAAEIAAWLLAHGYRQVRGMYGCSMGGAVAARFTAEGRVRCGGVVIDGGITPYQLPRALTYLIAVRDWAMVELGKHCSLRMLRTMFSPEKYSEQDLLYVKKVLGSLSARTIWRSFYSCNNYSMPDPIPPAGCPMQYWYGAEEKRARAWDIAYIQKAFPKIELVENQGMGHAEYFTLHPVEFCGQLTAFFDAAAGQSCTNL